LDGKCLRDTHEKHHGVEDLSAKDGETVRTDSQLLRLAYLAQTGNRENCNDPANVVLEQLARTT
jgi:hypothetical protein